MSTWKYKFKKIASENDLELVDKPIVTWVKTEENQDDSYINNVVDAEIHDLTAEMRRIETDIYNLRKWQKNFNKEKTT